ncbi:MAG: InlB B-repeat-containing protein [Firmicutes bacterium]|nr:InlB B-repeat-containing protein [Bacillota bacterium]
MTTKSSSSVNARINSAKFRVTLVALILMFLVVGGLVGYYVIYNPNRIFVVTFDTNGGTAIQNQYVARNRAVVEPNAPTRANYVFDGWFGNSELTNAFNFYSGISNATTAHARWRRIELGIIYNSNCEQGLAEINENVLKNVGMDLAGANLFTRYGFELIGWNTRSDGNGESFAFEESVKLTQILTLYAVWQAQQRSITYNSNSSANQTDTFTYLFSQSTHIGQGISFILANHHISSWNTQADGEGTRFDVDAAHTIVADLNLYAIWSPDARTVTYNAHTGVGRDVLDPTYFGATINLQTGTTFTKANHTLIGWSTTPGGTQAFNLGQSHIMDGNIVLYAIWQADARTVTFRSNCDDEEQEEIATRFGLSVVLNQGFTRANFDFAGWNTQANGLGQSFLFGATHIMNANLVLYAIWTPEARTVTFNANGGLGVDVVIDTYFGADDLDAIANTFTRHNYTFMGWSLTSGTNNLEDMQPLESFGTITTNVSLFAVWEYNHPWLSFTLVNEGQEWSVSGVRGAPLHEFRIPETFRRLPVTHIAPFAFFNINTAQGDVTPSPFGTLVGDIVIPAHIRVIGSEAFRQVAANGNLILHDGLEIIGQHAFYRTQLRGNLNLPSTLTHIHQGAFTANAGFIGDLTIPANVVYLGVSAFNGCSGLNGRLTILAQLTTIPTGAFSSTRFSHEIVIPSSVTTLGEQPFTTIQGTPRIYIPASVVNVGAHLFYGVNNTEVHFGHSGPGSEWHPIWLSSNFGGTIVWNSPHYTHD